MHVLILLSIGCVAGAALGVAFFGGLWWTSQQLATSAHAGILLALSFVGRLTLLALCIVVLARINAALLIGAVPGLLAARTVWTHAARVQLEPTPPSWTRGSGRGERRG